MLLVNKHIEKKLGVNTMSPPVSPVKHVDQSSPIPIFFHHIKYWMGRLITTCLEIPSYLYQLLTKVKTVALPIIQKSPAQSPPKSPFAFPIQSPLKTPIQSPIPPPITSPLATPLSEKDPTELDLMMDLFDEKKTAPSQRRLSLQLNPGTSTKDRIFENFLKSIGFKDIPTFLQKGIFSDLDGKPVGFPNLENLTGGYKVEWKIDADESLQITDPFTLSFQGEFKEGEFHGAGALVKENHIGSIFPVLDGRFDKNTFISGLAVSDDDYIEGTFKKGCKTGKGTIRYFKTNDPSDPLASHMEYHGEFSQGVPDGKGKALMINLKGIKLLAEGIFNKGILVKGSYYEDDGRIYKGEWSFNIEDLTNKFKGYLTNHKSHSSYEGDIQNGVFHGQGKYTVRQFCEYDDLHLNENHILSHIHKSTFIDYTCIGEFKEGKLFNGKQNIQWEDGKQGIQICENGVVSIMTVTTPDNCKYEGIFEPYVLTGHGKVYTPDGHEVYSGHLKCGAPHGYGTMTHNGETYNGEFEWGQLVSKTY